MSKRFICLGAIAMGCLMEAKAQFTAVEAEGTGSQDIERLGRVGNHLYYYAYPDTGSGLKPAGLWKSDGQTTTLVKAMSVNFASGTWSKFADLGGKAFFIFPENGYGAEPWVSDGTAEGTKRLKDIVSGSGAGALSDQYFTPRIFKGKALFAAQGALGKELWVSDGTEEGTKILKDIDSGSGNGIDGNEAMAELNGKLYFKGSTAADGDELWVTDGTPEGTRRVTDLNPGNKDGFAGEEILAFGGKIYFQGDNGSKKGVFSSDGTEGGTTLYFEGLELQSSYAAADWFVAMTSGSFVISNGTPGNYTILATSGADNFRALGTRHVFEGGGSAGPEPWVTDGTKDGTKLLKDIYAGNGYSIFGVGIFSEPVGGKTFFKARTATGDLMYQTDGTPEGTVPVPGYPAAWSVPDQFVKLGDDLFMVATATTNGGRELVRYAPGGSTGIRAGAAAQSIRYSLKPIAGGLELIATAPGDDPLDARITDLGGRLLASGRLKASGTARLPLPPGHRGLVVLHLSDGRRNLAAKILP